MAPLIARGRILGALQLASLLEDAFTREDAELLTQIAGQVALSVENAVAYREISVLKARLQEENVYLQEEIRQQHNFEEIIGSSASLKKVLEQVETVAATDSTVLILGETGTVRCALGIDFERRCHGEQRASLTGAMAVIKLTGSRDRAAQCLL